jgi:hypothetical protein
VLGGGGGGGGFIDVGLVLILLAFLVTKINFLHQN